MAPDPGHEAHDHTIQHQDAVEAVIADALDGAGAANVAIGDLDEITGGQSPTEGEHNSVVVVVNAILGALRNSGVIPSE